MSKLHLPLKAHPFWNHSIEKIYKVTGIDHIIVDLDDGNKDHVTLNKEESETLIRAMQGCDSPKERSDCFSKAMQSYIDKIKTGDLVIQ